MLYKLVRPLLFQLDSELSHNILLRTINVLSRVGLSNCARTLYDFHDPRLESEVLGIKFKNPLGLAAGFDKNAEIVDFLSAIGFGYIEIGTVTGKSQSGNPKPRIFRYPDDQALINSMGFPSEGADALALKLKQYKKLLRNSVLGINLGKTKVVPIDEALKDYLYSFSKLKDLGDLFVLNVSSPNTPELRKLQEKDRLKELFSGVNEINDHKKPILVKLAPDLSNNELDEIIECCLEAKVSGLIATNTTFSRDGLKAQTEEAGGLSGSPLKSRALEVVSHIYTSTNGHLPIMGVGGIFNAKDVIDFLQAGASVVQIYTALVYEGPVVVKKINSDLVRIIEKTGAKSIADFIGKRAL